MLLDKSLAAALSGYEFFGVKVYCDKNSSKKISDDLMKIFTEEWDKALEAVALEQEDEEVKTDNGFPLSVEEDNDGFFINTSSLDIRYCSTEYCDLSYGKKALKNALKKLKALYSDIEYEGLIVFEWSDLHCGDTCQFEIASNRKDIKTKVYDFVGKNLNEILKEANGVFEETDDFEDAVSESEFWKKYNEELENSWDPDVDNAIESIKAYSEWVDPDVLTKTIEIMGNFSEMI